MKVSQTRVVADGWCRLCLCEKVTSRPIFAKGAAFERLRSLILDCCPITLFDDPQLPSSICHRCENKLDITYQFRQLCRESERVLRARYDSSFRERCDTLRVIDRRTEADDQNETSREPKNRCPSSRIADRDVLKSFARDNDKVEVVSGKKRKEPEEKEDEDEREAGWKRLESELETRTSKQRRSEESEEVRKPANDGSFIEDNVETNEKKYICAECRKTFASKSGLRFHTKTHNGAKPHPCRHCGKRFAIPSYAKRHERIHTAEKQFICHVCSASFASSNGLRYHLRSHTGESNYRCETCGKSFRREKYLKEHVFTHTGEKPFVCKRCGAAYASSGSLFVHEKKCRRTSIVHERLTSPSLDRSK